MRWLLRVMVLDVVVTASVLSLSLGDSCLHDLRDLVSCITRLDPLELIWLERELRDLLMVVKRAKVANFWVLNTTD